MASNINYSDINTNYPIAGQENSSQGFRDNFSYIQLGLQTASEEITTLQETVTAPSNITGGSTNEILYQIGSNYTGFITAPTTSNSILEWNGTSFTWQTTPTLIGTNFSSIPNSALVNSSFTFGTTSQPLGSTISNIDDIIIGANTPLAGSFTSLSTSGTVSGTGFSTYLASPPEIGGTTPSDITGITITATTFAGPINGTIGATTPNTGTFSNVIVNGPISLQPPSVINASTYSVLSTDSTLLFSTTDSAITLPTASTNLGRVLFLNTITTNSVTSANTDVVPLGSSTAGTTILDNTGGKFAMLQSDGTYWITVLSN